jgi:hypothetical protein
MAIIRVEGIAKSYGKHQVHKDLTLSIERGECFTLLGPSGCVAAGGPYLTPFKSLVPLDDDTREVPSRDTGKGCLLEAPLHVFYVARIDRSGADLHEDLVMVLGDETALPDVLDLAWSW